jgi:putative ABC transport system ATP-binding protein
LITTQPINATQKDLRQVAPVIAIRNVSKSYMLGDERVNALQNISMDVQSGEFLTIIGPSGSGKSTLMNTIGCLDRPSSGKYWLVGQLVSKMSRAQLAMIRNRHIGFVFQGFNLLSRETALSNVALPLIYARVSRAEREERARQMLQMVGLGHRLYHHPNQLSGGQQQRIAIARALINRPSLLLADEPTGALDTRTTEEIMDLFRALNQQGLTIVLVTHDRHIASIAKRQVVIRDGRIIHDGEAAALDELLEEAAS